MLFSLYIQRFVYMTLEKGFAATREARIFSECMLGFIVSKTDRSREIVHLFFSCAISSNSS